MATIDTLLKYLQSKNVAEFIDEDRRKQIGNDVIVGYQIDDESRQNWLEVNKKALKLIKTSQNTYNDRPDMETNRDFPFQKSSKVVYPLIGPAVIQLSARMIQHVVRNNKVIECEVLGKDQPEVNPMTGQPTGLGIKESKADRVANFLSYESLIEDDSWLDDEHKLNSIVAAWGVGFKEVYYDHATKSTCTELLSPEDVIINHNVSGGLHKAPRITVRVYLTKNDIVEKIRSGEFLDLDLEQIESNNLDNPNKANDSREINPVHEFIRQICYLDLDDDGYAEPYYTWVHNQSKIVFGIYPAFEFDDVNIDKDGKILSISRNCGIIDRHLIDDPEGKFYSLGLNHLLYHPAKSITTILRQLIDAGTLKNASGTTGIVSRNIKTKERTLRVKLGEFVPVDIDPQLDLQKQFAKLPIEEPSQVLLSLLEVLIDNAKQTGFMTDILAGEAETQNVPATTMLAMVEQATRSFKPVVQKLYNSIKKEFSYKFKLHSKYMDQGKYFKFQDSDQIISKNDFDTSSMDICPVADPTMSSEAHKYARAQALFQIFQTPVAQACNIQEALTVFFNTLDFPNADQLVAQPKPPQPDPKLMDVQLKAQLAQKDQEIQQLKEQIKLTLGNRKLDLEQQKVNIKATEVGAKTKHMQAQTAKTIVDAHKDALQSAHTIVTNTHNMHINAHNAHTDRIEALAKAHQALNQPSGENNE